MDRRAWWATVHGVAKLNMTEQRKLSLSVASRYAVEPETENQLRKKKKHRHSLHVSLSFLLSPSSYV